MMDAIKIIECPRDALARAEAPHPDAAEGGIPSPARRCGFRHIDAVSFVSPKVVPQMSDSEAVLEQLGTLDGVEIIGMLLTKRRGACDRDGAVSTLGYPYSISETFLRRNQNQSLAENALVLEKIRDRAEEAGIGLVAYISMAFAIPMAICGAKRQLCKLRERSLAWELNPFHSPTRRSSRARSDSSRAERALT